MVFSTLYRCISDRTKKSSKGTQLAHVRGLEPWQSGCRVLIHHHYMSKPSPFLSFILQNPVPGLGREMAAYPEGRVQRLKWGSGRQWGWPLIPLWPLPSTLGLGWGWGGKTEVRSDGGEVHLAAGQALWRWVSGHSGSLPRTPDVHYSQLPSWAWGYFEVRQELFPRSSSLGLLSTAETEDK